jgi:hypothetical protein
MSQQQMVENNPALKCLSSRVGSHAFRWGALVLAACLLAAPATSLAARPAHPAGLVSAQQAVLRLSDVTHIFGKGFAQSRAGALPRQSAQSVAAAAKLLHTNAYTKLLHDWVAGYATEYDNALSLAGGMTVKSSVNVYKMRGIAQQVAEATFASRVVMTRRGGMGMFQSSLKRYSGVGEYAELTTSVMKSARGGTALHLPGAYQVKLSFTRGHYGVSVDVDSGSAIRLSAVLAAARVIDSRLHGG